MNEKQGFTKNQHVHSRHSLIKFCNDNKELCVHRKSDNKKHFFGPKQEIFCAPRVWDQRAEDDFKAIEESFHFEIDNLLPYVVRNHRAISEYYALWRTRQQLRLNPPKDFKIPSCIEKETYSNEDLEKTEKVGLIVAQKGVVKGRFSAGTQIIYDMMPLMAKLKKAQWGLITSSDGEFILADCYATHKYMPISPTKAFLAEYQDMSVDRAVVAELNRHSVSTAQNYYAAKDFMSCPL